MLLTYHNFMLLWGCPWSRWVTPSKVPQEGEKKKLIIIINLPFSLSYIAGIKRVPSGYHEGTRKKKQKDIYDTCLTIILVTTLVDGM
jgi:hypothetical protein